MLRGAHGGWRRRRLRGWCGFEQRQHLVRGARRRQLPGKHLPRHLGQARTHLRVGGKALFEPGFDQGPHPGAGLALAPRLPLAVGLLHALEFAHRRPKGVEAVRAVAHGLRLRGGACGLRLRGAQGAELEHLRLPRGGAGQVQYVERWTLATPKGRPVARLGP